MLASADGPARSTIGRPAEHSTREHASPTDAQEERPRYLIKHVSHGRRRALGHSLHELADHKCQSLLYAEEVDQQAWQHSDADDALEPIQVHKSRGAKVTILDDRSGFEGQRAGQLREEDRDPFDIPHLIATVVGGELRLAAMQVGVGDTFVTFPYR